MADQQPAQTFSTQFSVPGGDVIAYLRGAWKRSLEWRHFGGGYQHLGTSNTVIAVEDAYAAGAADRRDGGDGAGLSVRRGSITDESRHLRWSFGGALGPTHNDMKEGYVMKFIPDQRGTYMEWEHSGVRCHGHFDPGTSVMTLNFNLPDSKVTATYRAMDANTMAVCLIEVGSSLVPTVQYGNMHRLRLADE